MQYHMHRHRCSSIPTRVFSSTQFPEVGETRPGPKGTLPQSWNQRRRPERRLGRANPKVAANDWRTTSSVRSAEMGVFGLRG